MTIANEQLEYLRLEIIRLEDQPRALTQLALAHFPKLIALCAEIAQVRPEESRTTILLKNIDELLIGWHTDHMPKFAMQNFMTFVDLVCRIRQLTNQDKVRNLIDIYEGGWVA